MPWYDSAFSYKKAIVIPHANVSGGSDLLDFPVLISLTDTSLKSQSNGGLVASSSGYDLLFTDGTEIRELPYEVESYTASSGALVCWVRVPVVSASQDTTLYLYFGNSAVSGFQATASTVWDSHYKAVYHLSDNAANTTVKDSSTTAANGTASANTSTKTVTGQIAAGLTFNGSSDQISIASSVLSSSNTFTLECWFNSSSLTQTDACLVYVGTSGTGYGLFYGPNATNAHLGALFDSVTWIDSNYSVPATGAWHHLALVRANGITSFYVDGVVQSGTSTATPVSPTTSTAIGKFAGQPGYFAGLLDEVRLSDSNRSASWIATSYTNQSAPSSFIWLGATIPFTANVGQGVMNASAVTTTQTSANQINVGGKGVALTFNVTICGSGETFSVTVQGKDATSGAYYTIASFGGLGLGSSTLTIYPGLTPSATTSSNVLPKVWCVYVTPGTSDSATYTIGASLLS